MRLVREVKRSFMDVALRRGLGFRQEELDKIRERAAKRVQESDPLPRRTVRKNSGSRADELEARREAADAILKSVKRITLFQAARDYPEFTWHFWREYLVETVRRGVADLRPAKMARDDVYEWRDTDGSTTGGGG